MYAIKFTRCTGETRIGIMRFSNRLFVEQAIANLQRIDKAKGRENEHKYEIIEIENESQIWQ